MQEATIRLCIMIRHCKATWKTKWGRQALVTYHLNGLLYSRHQQKYKHMTEWRVNKMLNPLFQTVWTHCFLLDLKKLIQYNSKKYAELLQEILLCSGALYCQSPVYKWPWDWFTVFVVWHYSNAVCPLQCTVTLH